MKNMRHTRGMLGASEHLWCSNGRYLFNQPAHEPPPNLKNSYRVIPQSDGRYFCCTSHHATQNTFVTSKYFLLEHTRISTTRGATHNMKNTRRMWCASKHLWCVPTNGKYLFTKLTHAPHSLIPEIATVVCP